MRSRDRRPRPGSITVARVERFNFTRDVLDRSTGRALVFMSASGEVRELSFEEVSARAARWTNMLRRRGIEPGDRVLVLLGKTPEWNAAMCGCLKAAAVAIPCSEMLRAKDLDFRARHSGAKLLVADAAARDELDRMEVAVDVLTLDQERLGVDVLCQAPTEYRIMAKQVGIERHDLSRLREAVSAGEPLNPEVIKAFRDAFDVTIRDGYGQTENTLLVGNLPGMEIRPGSMGLPTPGHDVAGLDGEGSVDATG